MKHAALPVHPTMRHPHTGKPLQAIYVRQDGRVFWPVLGGSPDDPPADPPADPPKNDPADPPKNDPPKDDPDLGFPKGTPVAEMTDKQATAYWKHKARKHEGRVSELVGDRTPEEVKKDLAELADLRKAQQTPAEQALAEAKEQGKKEAITAERTKTAATIFKAALEANQVPEDDIDELVTNFNVAGYISDDGVDTTKITNFAKKFAPSGKDTSSTRRRDFGGGSRTDDGQHGRGSGGKAEAERRFGKKDKQTT